MEKCQSFFDWELRMKNKTKSIMDQQSKKNPTNSLGLSQEEYEEFLHDWKDKNLRK